MLTRLLSAASAGVLVATLAIAGCSSSDDGGSSDGTPTKMFPTDFEPACRSNPVAGATAYSATTPGVHKLVVLTGKDTNQLDEAYLDLPTEWTILFNEATDEYAKAELVLCVVRTSATLAEECTGYESDGEDTGNVVQLYSAEYAVSMHEATTGKELGATAISAEATECPGFVMFSSDEDSKDWFETNDAAVAEFARPFAQV
jgi:hypothetical protein